MELGRYTEAIKQGEELLELCESDNYIYRIYRKRVLKMEEQIKELTLLVEIHTKLNLHI